MAQRKRLLVLGLLVSPFVVFLFSLTLGPTEIPFPALGKALLSPIVRAWNDAITPVERDILFGIRLPRLLLGLAVGAALSVSGASLQAVFKNPLVNEYILGLSSGAAFGASLSIVVLGSAVPPQIAAFVFALLAVALVLLVSRTSRSSPISILLTGVIISAFFSALLSLVEFFASPYSLQSLFYWLMGNLGTAGWPDLAIPLPLIAAGTVPLLLMSWRLNVLSLEDEDARSLGVNVKRDQRIVVLLATLITAAAVCPRRDFHEPHRPALVHSPSGEVLEDLAMNITVRNLRYARPGFELLVPAFDVAAADITSIVGPNGAGKTTFLKCLSGLWRPAEGRIRIDGSDLDALGDSERARRLAFVPQEHSAAFNFSVLEFVLMGRTARLPLFGAPSAGDRAAAEEALAYVGFPHPAARPMFQLSSGERRLVLIARALAQEADILVLDEPTTFLDPRHETGIMELIRRLSAEQGKTIIVTLHDLNLAIRYSGRIVFLKDGRIVADGRPDDILTRELLRRVYEIPMDIVDHDGRRFIVK
ncbi:MAG: iron chelate uptake ABC transporter family permease subunit [Candidatus Aminicenantes bacterium]|nr:iron chelate uptake ABC transporter family permease subunit [Candidatus Aminicenantes bacterium]